MSPRVINAVANSPALMPNFNVPFQVTQCPPANLTYPNLNLIGVYEYVSRAETTRC